MIIPRKLGCSARDVRESFKHHTLYLYTIPYSQVSEGRCVVTCVTIPKRSHPYALQDCFYWNLWLYASTIFSDPYFASFLFQFSLDIVNVVVPFIVCWIFLGLFHLRSRYGLYFVEVIYIYTHLRIEFKNKFIQRNVYCVLFWVLAYDGNGEYLVVGNPFSAAHGFRHILMLFVCMNDCLVHLTNINVSGRRHLILLWQRV